jgi:hypothetical protein
MHKFYELNDSQVVILPKTLKYVIYTKTFLFKQLELLSYWSETVLEYKVNMTLTP